MFLSLPAFGGLILLGPENFAGTGLGNVNTALTIQDNDGDEQGCVGWTGSATGTGSAFCNGVLAGATNNQAQNNSFTVGGLLINDLSEVRVVFNASEPGNASNPNNAVTLNTLVLNFLNPTSGAVVASAELAAPIAFPNTFNGVGNSGFVFGIDAAQQISIGATLGASGLAFGDLRLGLVARATDAQGGLETFYIARTADPGDPGDPIPEPGTYVTLAAGLLGLAMWRRRTRA